MSTTNLMQFRQVSIFRYTSDYYDRIVAIQILPLTLKIFLWSIVFLAAIYLVRRAFGTPIYTEAKTPQGSGRVERYEAGARLYHWGGVFVLTAGLAASGLALYQPGAMPSTPISWLRLHEVFAGLFVVGVLLHIGFSLTQGEPWSMWFDRGDRGDLMRMMGYALGRQTSYPHFGKYDVVQKLYHLMLALLVAVLIFSGSTLTLNAEVLVSFDHDWMRQQRLLHDASSFLIIGMVVMHAYLRLLKANWPTLIAMFTGTISLDYFRRHHDYQRWSPPTLPAGEDRDRIDPAAPVATVSPVERTQSSV